MSEAEEIQLNLKWDNFSSHLALSFDSCYESQQFVDVSLVCKDGEVIKGHKMILANTSKFFRRLLTENEHPHPMIVLHTIDADDLRSLMTFMYCGEVQVFQNDLKKLLEIADTLEITGLQQIQELDNPGIRFGVKNFATLNRDFDQTENAKNDADSEMHPGRSNKPASNLLKYVSSLGKKNLDNSVQSFESSSKKLQEMARKFEKCSNVGTWSFMQHVPIGNEAKIKEVSNDCTLKTLQKLPDGEPEVCLDLKSSSRKLQEMAKLLENINRNPALSEASKGTSEGQKRSIDSEEITESPAKKPNLNRSTANTSEAEPEVENIRLSTARDTNAGRSITEEQHIQNYSVFIKDELDVNTDCSTTPDVDLDNLQTDNLNVTNNGEHSGTSMLAAELLKAVANKRKDTRSLHVAIQMLTYEVRRQSNEIQELRNCLKRRGFLNKSDTVTVQSFAEEHGLTLQLQTVEEFKDFDQRLKDETEFCTNFVSTLEHLLEKEIQKSITAILKSYISRDLAISCTAIRRSNDKMIFKGTKFNDCLFALICQYHRGERNEPVTEKEYYQALSSCLSNAKDWHGHRLVRRQQQGAAVRRNANSDRDVKNVPGSVDKLDELGYQDSGNTKPE